MLDNVWAKSLTCIRAVNICCEKSGKVGLVCDRSYKQLCVSVIFWKTGRKMFYTTIRLEVRLDQSKIFIPAFNCKSSQAWVFLFVCLFFTFDFWLHYVWFSFTNLRRSNGSLYESWKEDLYTCKTHLIV